MVYLRNPSSALKGLAFLSKEKKPGSRQRPWTRLGFLTWGVSQRTYLVFLGGKGQKALTLKGDAPQSGDPFQCETQHCCPLLCLSLDSVVQAWRSVSPSVVSQLTNIKASREGPAGGIPVHPLFFTRLRGTRLESTGTVFFFLMANLAPWLRRRPG